MSSDEEPNVFPVIPDRHDIPCPLCQRKTVLHSKRRRRFRHGHAWNVGIPWIELDVPRQRCFSCDLTFVYDYGPGLVRTSTEVFRKGIAERCHGRTISDVAREYGLPYTTVERWFYRYASVKTEKHTTDVLIDEFATRKGHHYATIAKSIQNREEAMRRTIVSSLSNGKMEGTNNKIKLIKRRGYGYRNLERFFLRLRFELGR